MTSSISWPVWRLSGVIVFGAFASGLDASLANIGLHTISADLHAPLSRTQWVASGYLLALAVSLPLAGWLGRKRGVGRVWLGALAGFTVASGLCAVAPTIETLIGLLGVSVAFAAVPTGISAYQTVSRDQLPDATAQVTILQRLGGAVGGALFSLVLAGHLAAGPQVAFHAAFRTMTAAAFAALISAFILWRVTAIGARPSTPRT